MIPKKGPVILALNHPTAFLDPVFVCTHIRPITHFMLRGDIFNSPLNRWMLKQIKTIPVFRFRDGYSSLKNNQVTFDYCYQLLHEKAHIIILSEGQTKHEKKLRPIQKGTAKMAFGVYEKYGDEDICIIPVGLNYTDSVQFRSELMVEAGLPIYIKDYMEAYEENPRKAILQITREIQNQLNDRVIHIAKDEDEPFVNKLLLIHRNTILKTFLPVYSNDNSLLRKEIEIARTINSMKEAKKTTLKKEVENYFGNLGKLNIPDIAVAQPHQYSIKNTFLLLLGFIPFLAGTLINFLPFYFGKKVANEKVRRMEFHSSIRFGVAAGFYTIIFFLLLIAAFFINHYLFWGFLILAPFLCHFAVLYQDIFHRWNQVRKAGNLDKSQLSSLIQQRKALVSRLVKVNVD